MLIRQGFHANCMCVSIVTVSVLAWLAKTLLCLILQKTSPLLILMNKRQNGKHLELMHYYAYIFPHLSWSFLPVNVSILRFKCLGIFTETVKYCSVTLVVGNLILYICFYLFIIL